MMEGVLQLTHRYRSLLLAARLLHLADEVFIDHHKNDVCAKKTSSQTAKSYRKSGARVEDPLSKAYECSTTPV